MTKFRNFFVTICLLAVSHANVLHAQTSAPKPIKVLVIGAVDKYHSPMVKAAEPFFKKLATQNNIDIDLTRDTSVLTEENLAKYQVLIQLHVAPFDLSPQHQYAIQQFISKGKGWIGVHAAGLTGKEFLKPNQPYWQWFEQLMGNVLYSPHPPLQQGTVLVEDHNHPVTKNLPASFSIKDEWYELFLDRKNA